MTGANDFLLAEYSQLRSEILKRSEFQHQLISIALVAFGALVSVGLRDSPSALLAYPMLAMFLSASWSYNDIQIAQIGIYIRHRIERQLIGDGLGWEHAIVSDRASKRIGARIKLATRGILLGTQFLVLGLYLLNRLSTGFPEDPVERNGAIVLLILAIAAILFSLVILRNEDALVKEIDESMKKPVVAPSADRHG
jgi:uncharacterized membrane protein